MVNKKALSLDIVKAVLNLFNFFSALSLGLLCFTRWNTGEQKLEFKLDCI